MKNTIIKTSDLVIEFAEASKRNDFEHLKFLLHENGEFNIQDKELETIKSNKSEFLSWYISKLENIQITEISYDQCLHCSIGNSVVILNDGQFPRTIKDSSERSKTGFMIVVKDNKIITLKFCYVFAKTENKCVFENNLDKINVLKEQGLSFKEAYKQVTGNDISDEDMIV